MENTAEEVPNEFEIDVAKCRYVPEKYEERKKYKRPAPKASED